MPPPPSHPQPFRCPSGQGVVEWAQAHDHRTHHRQHHRERPPQGDRWRHHQSPRDPQTPRTGHESDHPAGTLRGPGFQAPNQRPEEHSSIPVSLPQYLRRGTATYPGTHGIELRQLQLIVVIQPLPDSHQQPRSVGPQGASLGLEDRSEEGRFGAHLLGCGPPRGRKVPILGPEELVSCENAASRHL